MELKGIAIGATITLLVVAAIGGLVYVTNTNTNTPDTTNDSPSQVTVSETVNTSKPGATALKQSLNENDYSNARVFIQKDGAILVAHNSSANSGPELKGELKEIAFMYSDVMATHNETGSLTVHANGVTLMVSPDAAAAHAAGSINDEAYTETFHYTSPQKEE